MTGPSDFSALKAAVDAGKVHVDVDLQRACHPNCPLPFEHLKGRVVYGYFALIAAAIAAHVWLSIPAAMLWGGFALVSLLYWTVVRKLAENHFRRHIVAYALEEEDRWAKLWRFGGLTIAGSDGTKVAAPAGDWRALPGTGASS
jgi:hypothetical protein